MVLLPACLPAYLPKVGRRLPCLVLLPAGRAAARGAAGALPGGGSQARRDGQLPLCTAAAQGGRAGIARQEPVMGVEGVQWREGSGGNVAEERRRLCVGPRRILTHSLGHSRKAASQPGAARLPRADGRPLAHAISLSRCNVRAAGSLCALAPVPHRCPVPPPRAGAPCLSLANQGWKRTALPP